MKSKSPGENHGKNGNDGKQDAHHSHDSHSSHSKEPERVLPPRGDYQTLLSFQKAEVIYDITFRFAHQYLSPKDRTIDQQLKTLEKEFTEQGGLRERMTRVRLAQRNKRPQ